MDGRIDITYEPPPPPASVAPPPATPQPFPLPYWMRKFRTVVMAVAAVFVVRALFLEPFGIPTGSMALTILGVHREVLCPNCTFPVRVGDPNEVTPRGFFDVDCPNCGARNLGLGLANPIPGDRLLVDKSSFDWRSPRRWEIAVFRAPDDPEKPYIKRVAGLAGETIRIAEGDVLINGELARKSLSQCRRVGVPILVMDCRPTEGWDARWSIDGPGPPDARPRIMESELHFAESKDAVWRSLTFRSLHDRPIGDSLPYNGRRNDLPIEWVHDFLVTCEIVVRSGDGELAFSLTDGADVATVTLSTSRDAVVSAGGQASGATGARLRPGGTHQLELAFIDRRVSFRWDSNIESQPIDLLRVEHRRSVNRPLQIRAIGLDVVVRNCRLIRDLHYTAAGRLGTGQCRLAADEYFMLGDNSCNSEDSRFWRQPGVPAQAIIGRPILMYAPSRWRRWSALGRTWDVQAIDENRFGWIR